MRFVFLFLFLNSCLVHAQDTIFLRNNTVEAATILEVSSETIRYKRTNNPDGPVFVKQTPEINYIRFRNGDIQRFDTALMATPPSAPEFQPLTYQGNILIYRDRPLGDGKLKMLIETHPDHSRRKPMLKEFEKMKRYRSRQYFWGIGGPVIGGYTFMVAATMAISQVGVPVQYIAIGAAVGGGVFLASLNQSKMNKQKRLMQKQKIAAMYNGN